MKRARRTCFELFYRRRTRRTGRQKTCQNFVIFRDPGSAQPSFDASWQDEHAGTLGLVNRAKMNLNRGYFTVAESEITARQKTCQNFVIFRDPGSANPSFDASWRDEHDGTLGVVIWAQVNLNMSSTSLLHHFSGCNFSERSATIGNHATEMKLSTSSTTLAEKLIFTKGLLLVSNRVFAPIQKLWKAWPWPRGLSGTCDGISFAYRLTSLRVSLHVRSAKSSNVGRS